MPLFELCSLSSSERQKFDVIASNNELKLDDHRATNRSKKRWGGRERKWIARVTRFVHVHSFCLLLCCCIDCRAIHFTTHTYIHTHRRAQSTLNHMHTHSPQLCCRSPLPMINAPMCWNGVLQLCLASQLVSAAWQCICVQHSSAFVRVLVLCRCSWTGFEAVASVCERQLSLLYSIEFTIVPSILREIETALRTLELMCFLFYFNLNCFIRVAEEMIYIWEIPFLSTFTRICIYFESQPFVESFFQPFVNDHKFDGNFTPNAMNCLQSLFHIQYFVSNYADQCNFRWYVFNFIRRAEEKPDYINVHNGFFFRFNFTRIWHTPWNCDEFAWKQKWHANCCCTIPVGFRAFFFSLICADLPFGFAVCTSYDEIAAHRFMYRFRRYHTARNMCSKPISCKRTCRRKRERETREKKNLQKQNRWAPLVILCHTHICASSHI